MREQFLQFIRKEKLFSPFEKILLAVSGGVDSVVMCELFHQSGLKFGIAHCNFKMRGKESDDDEKFVGKLAEKYNVPVHSKSFLTEQYADERKISIQMAARELRYSFFEEVRTGNNYSFIATAHHQSDVMETMLLNLTRGTGISGLHGILPKRGKIIRPLLFAARDEIEKFALENKISFRVDSSNASEKYQRNLIRKKIVPALKQINPSAENSFYESSLRMRGAEKLLLDFVDAFSKTNVTTKKDKTMIPIQAVASFDYGEAVLFELLKPFGFSSSDVVSIFEAADSISGKQFYSSTHCLTRDRKYFIITPLTESSSGVTVCVGSAPAKIIFQERVFFFSTEDAKKFSVPRSSEISCLDFDKIKFPLTLRRWKPGDRFQPLGMKTGKKVSDFLVDMKVPMSEKKNVLVCLSEDKITCLPSFRIDERFRVTGKTKTVLVIVPAKNS
ncbi:MAG TPA: tRNA lysidine(34) synthetase TilS [Bacteroidia bacterium]|nr:tRNA lysidine(34) synthetase TilS [Bacteroidia bacterium]